MRWRRRSLVVAWIAALGMTLLAVIQYRIAATMLTRVHQLRDGRSAQVLVDRNGWASGRSAGQATFALYRRGSDPADAARDAWQEKGRRLLPADPVVQDPELQNLYLAARRAQLLADYAPLFRSGSIALEQRQRLEALLVRRQELEMDLADIAEIRSLASDDPALRLSREQVAREFRRDVAAELGPQIYATVADYERLLPLWRLVANFAGRVALEGAPLSPVQADRLVNVLAEASGDYHSGGIADPNGIDWNAVPEKAAEVLTPAQQHSFRNALPIYAIAPTEGGLSAPSPSN